MGLTEGDPEGVDTASACSVCWYASKANRLVQVPPGTSAAMARTSYHRATGPAPSAAPYWSQRPEMVVTTPAPAVPAPMTTLRMENPPYRFTLSATLSVTNSEGRLSVTGEHSAMPHAPMKVAAAPVPSASEVTLGTPPASVMVSPVATVMARTPGPSATYSTPEAPLSASPEGEEKEAAVPAPSAHW